LIYPFIIAVAVGCGVIIIKTVFTYQVPFIVQGFIISDLGADGSGIAGV
jgi:hypothetical protein